jgi:hypothetical protein
MSSGPLRLLAQTPEDLDVISAALQDAVGRIGEIRFEAGPRQLTLAFNRFRWEGGGPKGERVRTGLQLGGVTAVRARNLRAGAKDAIISLLAITFEAGQAPGGAITLTFAGGGDLQAEVECIDVALADVSEAWPTPRTPGHD